jgi:hypothetical protein
MRPASLLVSLLAASGFVFAQGAPAPAAPPAAPAPDFPTPEQLAELACANEYQFLADKIGDNRYLLRVDTQSPDCRGRQRTVLWKISGDDGVTFIELKQGAHVRSVKPVAQGVEIEVAPAIRYYALGSVPVMDGVTADSPVISFGRYEGEPIPASAPAAPPARTANRS